MLIRYAMYIIILSILIFIPFLNNKEKPTSTNIIKRTSMNIKLVKEEMTKKTQIARIKKIKKQKVKQKPKKPNLIEEKKIIKPTIDEVQEEQEAQKEVINIQNKHIETLKERYFNSIYDSISKYKKYPKKAKRFKQEGDVKVNFHVNKNGMISKFKILSKNKYSSLNKAVIKIFDKLKYFEKPPTELKLPLKISITISYKLK